MVYRNSVLPSQIFCKSVTILNFKINFFLKYGTHFNTNSFISAGIQLNL